MRRATMVAVGASALTLAVPVGIWLALAQALDRAAVNQVPGTGGGGGDGGGAAASGVPPVNLLDYLWQFYLPKLPFEGNVPAISRLPVFDIWIKGSWGAFGWLEVRFPDAVYVTLALVTVVLLGGATAKLVLRRRRDDLLLVAFLATPTLALLAGLHWIEYKTIGSEGVIFNQGRYLLPLLPLLGVSAAATLTLVPEGWRPRATGLVMGGACVLQFFSLAVIAGRFYA